MQNIFIAETTIQKTKLMKSIAKALLLFQAALLAVYAMENNLRLA